jgi:hypothetical protein
MDQSPAPPTSPPTVSASKFSLSIAAVEIIVVIGQTRTSFDIASPEAKLATDWLAAYSMSPVAVAQLAKALANAVALYERRYGKIPEDPTFSLNASGPSSQPPKSN